MGRGAMYAVAIAAPGYVAYQQAPGTAGEKATAAIQAYGGIGAGGQFDWAVVKQMYTPIVVWTVADMALSKLGAWRKLGRFLRM